MPGSLPSEKKLKSSMTTTMSDRTTTTTTCYAVREIPGKGLGLVAVRPILAGELILAEKPLLTVPREIHASRDANRIEDFLLGKLALENETFRRTFWALADHKAGGGGGEKTALGIYLTNYFRLGLSADSATGLLPLITRSNHACAANAESVWRENANWEELRAKEEIGQGVEITQCYIPLVKKGKKMETF